MYVSKICSSKQCVSGRFVFWAGLCQHSKLVFVCPYYSGKLGGVLVLSGDLKQCWKLRIGRLLFKESHFNYMF